MKPKDKLEDILEDWGKYEFKGNTIYLYNNSALSDPVFLQIAKNYQIKIQLNLFS